jgi:transitional endoplasmic reticulum ATPase
MRTPDQAHNYDNPYSPEGEPKPKGFGVRIENPDLIFDALQRGNSGELGRCLLEEPIKEVGVELIAENGTFNLLANVTLNSPIPSSKFFKEETTKNIIQVIARGVLANNPEDKIAIAERGGNFIITAPRGTKFVLGENPLKIGVIIISTGLTKTLGPNETLQLVPAPSSSRESYNTVMADFIDFFKAAVEEVYKAYGKTPPDEELVLQPPRNKANVLGRGQGISEGTETPEQLLGKLEIEKPSVAFEDIGGQTRAKREIQGIAFALKNPELYKKWGTKPPKGIILYGPPGTGKTLLAKALASQANARFFRVSASDIASKWYGESEGIVKSIFELASSTGENTIIFFDEIDAIAPQREGAHEATHRVVSTFLENMDGIVSKKNVIVVASTNRLESIDPALLRAGRFDRWVEVPLPDKESRKQILNVHMRKAEETAGRKLFGNVDLDEIVSKTENLTGADIAEIIRRVLEEKVREEGIGLKPGEVTTEDMLREIKNYERVRRVRGKIGFSATFEEK